MRSQMEGGYEVVLTAGRGFMADYRISGFASVVPSRLLSGSFFKDLAARYMFRIKSDVNGRMKLAPLGLGRIEASLLEHGFRRESVAIVDPEKLERAVGPKTKVVGISCLDPLDRDYGVQLLKCFHEIAGLEYEGNSYLSYSFLKMIEKIKHLRQKYSFRVILGGPGAWQIIDMGVQKRLGVDCIVEGEGEKVVGKLFKDTVEGREIPGKVKGKPAAPDEIPIPRTPSREGIVEISRGCGRGCKFCNPGMAWFRPFPEDKILKETEFNVERGVREIALHSEDFLRYGAERLRPTKRILELVNSIVAIDGLKEARPNFITASSTVQDPELVKECAITLGIQKEGEVIEMGIETGSPRLVESMMPGKPKPYKASEWPELNRKAVEILNDCGWVVCGTMIVGAPGEREEDLIKDLELVRSLEDSECLIWPLPFIPSARGRMEKPGIEKVLQSPPRERIITECLLQSMRVVKRNVNSIMKLPLLRRIVAGYLLNLAVNFVEKGAKRALEELPNPLDPRALSKLSKINSRF